MPTLRTISREHQGAVLCALAALGFGSMGVLAKLSYAAGTSVLTLVSVRFTIGAVLLWAIAARLGVARIADRRAAAGAFALGLLVYSTESGLYSAALTTIDASLAELLMFSYPAIVVVAAIALRRERPSRRRAGAVAIASAGVALVLLGGSTGRLAPTGIALTLVAAVLYAGYVLCADALAGRLHPLTFAALVCTGAAVSFSLAGAASGSLRLTGLPGEAWLWMAIVAVGATAFGMSAFIAGVERLGPSRAAIMSALDPVVAVVGGSLVFAERLGPLQFAGGVLVISAVLVLQLPAVARLRTRRTGLRAAGRAGPGAVARRPACAAEPVAIPSRDRGASARPAPQPSAGSLALVTAERR